MARSSRKFGRAKAQRSALIASLAQSLIINESVETTLPKAKVLVSHTEKLLSKAKTSGLHTRRHIIKQLPDIEAANKLVDEIAPKLKDRSSGYFRIKRTYVRVGDGAQMAKVSFVDSLEKKAVKKEPTKKQPTRPSPSSAKKPPATAAAKKSQAASRKVKK